MKTLLLLLPGLLAFPVLAPAGPFRLPFDGTWFVMQGGDTPNVNHHMAARPQWYGIDFMKVAGPSGRELHSGSGESLEDFFSWNEPVLAPAAGVVVRVVDGLPDNPIGVKDPMNPAGNHVVIETESGAYLFLGHLRKGTISVDEGAEVAAGDRLGTCGNSGNSDMPHIHLHMQDTPDIRRGLGQNIVFTGIRVELNGKLFDGVDWPLIRGLFVSNH